MSEIKLNKLSMDKAAVTGSAPWNNGSDTADNVIDGNTQTFFDGVQNGWLEIDLGETLTFDVIAYAPRTGFEGRMVGGRFYGSKDGKK